MKIALTGGSGFIGRWFLREYAGKYDMVVIGRRDNISEITVDKKMFRYCGTDYSVKSLSEILSKVDSVLHLAAMRRAVGDRKDTFLDYVPNIDISANLFESCYGLGIKNIVNISSQRVYGISNELPFTELQVPFPDSYYGLAKVITENHAEQYNDRNKLNVKTLRVAQVVGAGEISGYMLTKFIDKAINKNALEIYGSGQGRRDYIYIKDVINAIDTALTNADIKGIFNIGTGDNTSHLELAQIINKVFDNEKSVVYLPDRQEDKTIRKMDVNKAKEFLGWKSNWDLHSAFEDMKILYFETSNQHKFI